MNVLVTNLHFYHFRNIAGCLQTIASEADVETFLWNSDEKPVIDVFDEIHPDLVFLHESQLSEAFNIVCKEFNFDYVLVGSRDYPKIPKKPAALITSENFMHNFTNQDNVMTLLPAAKVTEIHAAQKLEELESEVLIITGVVPHTEPVLDSMRSLCHTYRTKVIGEAPVPIPNYLGKVSMFERANFIKSTKVLVDFGSYDYLDAAYLKIPAILGQPPLPGLGEVKTFSDIPTLMAQVERLLVDEKSAQEYSTNISTHVRDNHTYYHRCSQIFTAIGKDDISNTLLSFLKELLK